MDHLGTEVRDGRVLGLGRGWARGGGLGCGGDVGAMGYVALVGLRAVGWGWMFFQGVVWCLSS